MTPSQLVGVILFGTEEELERVFREEPSDVVNQILYNIGCNYAGSSKQDYEKYAILADARQAIRFWTIASKRSDAKSQYMLGVCYTNGQGYLDSDEWYVDMLTGRKGIVFGGGQDYVLLPNYKKAKYWLEKAIEQGHKEAEEQLEIVEEKALSGGFPLSKVKNNNSLKFKRYK